jgi:hypothetical protein
LALTFARCRYSHFRKVSLNLGGQRRPQIEIMPLPIDFSMAVSMAWHRRAASEPAQAWFRAQLIEAAGD